MFDHLSRQCKFSLVKSLSRVQLCNPMDCSTPGFPVQHQLLELAQIHIHWVGDASNHLFLYHSFLLLPSIHPSIRIFSMSQFFTSDGQSIEASASASVLPMNIQDWFPLLVCSFCSPRDSRESYPTQQFKAINYLVLSFLYGPTLTSIHDYWKNHSSDNMAQSILDIQENKSWIFSGRTDDEAEAAILWPPDVKNWLKRPWCWERLKVGGEGDDRGWDGWMASPTQWTWVWASPGSWWWTGRPGVPKSMGSQRARHNRLTEQQ